MVLVMLRIGLVERMIGAVGMLGLAALMMVAVVVMAVLSVGVLVAVMALAVMHVGRGRGVYRGRGGCAAA